MSQQSLELRWTAEVLIVSDVSGGTKQSILWIELIGWCVYKTEQAWDWTHRNTKLKMTYLLKCSKASSVHFTHQILPSWEPFWYQNKNPIAIHRPMIHSTMRPRHSYCRLCIYGLPIGCRNCVIYVTCKYMKACCCTQQMACRPFFSVGERQQVILARPGLHNGSASSLTSTIVPRITNQCEDWKEDRW